MRGVLLFATFASRRFSPSRVSPGSGNTLSKRATFGWLSCSYLSAVNTRNIAISFAAGIALGLLSMWLWMRHQSAIEALQRDVEHEKQQAWSAVLQSQRDSAATASRQWEQLYLQVAAEDKPKTIYLRADAKWSSNPSADSVRAYLRFRPDSILDRWYPGKGSDHPGSPQ